MDSSGLLCNSVQELVASSELTEQQKQQLERKSADMIYSSMKTLIAESAKLRGDLEAQYRILMRAGNIGKLILDSKRQADWTLLQQKQFKTDLELCVKDLHGIQATLQKKYDQKKIRQSQKDKENEKKEAKKKTGSELFEHRKQFWPLITPRELIKKVEDENPKKSAIVFDFRVDQTEIIDWKRSEMITVIQVPNQLIDSGLTFNTLRNTLSVSQRGLLPRLSGCDYVILMEDESPELFNGNVVHGRKSFFLYRAFTAYMPPDIRLKERPLFMEGGFRSWKNHYPGYTTHVQPGSARSAPSDDLDNAILKYLPTTGLSHIKYPDLMSVRIADGESATPVVPPRPSQVSPPAHLVAPEPVVRGFGALPQPSVPPRPTVSTYERPGAPIFTAPPAAAASAAAAASTVKPTLPDRTSKPAFPERPALLKKKEPSPTREPRQNGGGGPLKRPPLLDRSAKPLGTITTRRYRNETENRLQSIYGMMIDSLAMASRRGGSSSRPGATGLFNMGNTCFMSATLQCLFQTPGLSDVFTKKSFVSHVNPDNRMGSKGVFSAGFSAISDLVWGGDFEAIKPARFLQFFADIVTDYLSDGRQHDASEFQLFLLDALHEDTNTAPRARFEQNYKGGAAIRQEFQVFLGKHRKLTSSPLNRLLGAISVSEIRCGTCGETSATFEENAQITVELTSTTSCTLDSCLRSHFSQSSLDGDSKWNCPNCKQLRDSTRTSKLWALPPVLIIHLKRFTLWNGEFEKNQTAVTFDPNHFDARPHMHEAAQDTNTRYRLYAATIHSGRLNSGHYTAVASNLRTGKWLRFDDESVRQIDSYNVDPSLVYILFYKRC